MLKVTCFFYLKIPSISQSDKIFFPSDCKGCETKCKTFRLYAIIRILLFTQDFRAEHILSILIYILFSSSNNQLRIPNICNEFFVYLLFQWCYQVKVLNYITIQPKNANITLYIKKLKTLCNTLNWGN